jgi:hypothetical protein
MKKYNIAQNRPELSPEQINQGMDFNGVVQGAQASRKKMQTKLIATALVATMLIVVGTWFTTRGKDNKVETSGKDFLLTNKEKPAVFALNSEIDTTLIFETGTQIHIPAHAFVDKEGKPLKGLVNLEYKEYHNPGEILLSAIPMTYDTAGQVMQFISAGMFEIGAKQNGEAVCMAPHQMLEVSMATLDPNKANFNQYYLKDRTGKWTFEKKDTLVALQNPSQLVDSPPVNVKTKESHTPRRFKINASGRPDLEAYNNVEFEVTEASKSFNEQETKTEWGLVNIEQIAKGSNYKITFSAPSTGEERSYTVLAKPVNETAGAADRRYKSYTSSHATILQTANDRSNRLSVFKARFDKVLEKYQALQAANAELYRIQSVEAQKASEVMYRTFQVLQFGIFNSDCPASLPQGIRFAAKFTDANGKELKITEAFLIEKNKNAVWSLNLRNAISFDPHSTNTLLVITPDHKLGYARNDEFSKIKQSDHSFTFTVSILDKAKYDPADINRLL